MLRPHNSSIKLLPLSAILTQKSSHNKTSNNNSNNRKFPTHPQRRCKTCECARYAQKVLPQTRTVKTLLSRLKSSTRAWFLHSPTRSDNTHTTTLRSRASPILTGTWRTSCISFKRKSNKSSVSQQ